MQCLITGADLHIGNGEAYHGDLYEEGSCFIFVSVTNDKGAPILVTSGPDGSRTVRLDDDAPEFLERRGVMVIPKTSITPSDLAALYIARGKGLL
jgi:hypothetical protein